MGNATSSVVAPPSEPAPGDDRIHQDFVAVRALAQRPDPGKEFDRLFPPAASAGSMPPGDDQVQRDFIATRALAQRPDPWKALDARYAPAAAPATPAAGAPVPVDPNQPIADRMAQAVQTVAPGAPQGFLARLGEAAKGGALQSITDLADSAKVAAGGKPSDAAPPPDYAKAMSWADLAHPEGLLEKAAYQVAHGAPVVAAGVAGGLLGGAAGAEGVAEAGGAVGLAGGPAGAAVGATGGAVAGGVGGAALGSSLGAGAMSAAQSLGPFYAAALKANPNDPAAALQQAIARAGAAGVFTAAGWTMFGVKPFAGAVQNLLFQAFGVQPAVGMAAKATDNLESGQPVGQGVVESIPGSVAGTVLPAAVHTVVAGLAGAPAPAESAAAPAGQEAAPGAAPPNSEAPAGAPSSPAAEAAKPGAPAAPEQKPDIIPIGDVKADSVTVSPDIEKNALAYIDGKRGDNPVKVNLAYIGTDNIADTLERVSSMLPGQGVQSHESTQSLALGLNLQPDQFLAGYKGEQLDAAQTTAMRLMLDSTAQQLVQYATAATDPNTGSPAAMAQFLRAYTAHQGMQQYFENARAQAGRTLNAYQMMSRTSSDMTKAVGDLIANAGGATEVSALAQKIADLNDPEKVNQFVAVSRQMSARDMALYGYYNIILSNIPSVIGKKLLSDVSAATWEVATRALAPRLPGASGALARGEATQMMYGYASAFGDALRLAGRGIATGERQFEGGTEMDAVGGNRVRTIAEDAPQILNTDEPTRGAAEALKMFLPTRWIGAADDFAKYMNYRAELRALAYRYAVKSGTRPDDVDGHVQEILAAPPDAMHQTAVSNALRTTFQEPLTGLAQKITAVADAVNLPVLGTDFSIPVGRMVLPFIKVPANLTAWSYRNSPIAAVVRSAQVEQDMAAGGAARDVQVARMAMGTGLALASLGLAVNGLITGRGPADPGLNRAWRAAGNQPYSIKLFGTPYSYNRVDPFGISIGAIADTYDIMRFAPDHDRYNLAVSLAFGLGQNLLSKNYMEGAANLFDAFNSPDKGASKYIQGFVAGVMAPSAAQGLEKAVDPWVRAHYEMMDGIEARLPMLADNLPVSRTLWGDPISKQEGFLPGLSGTGFARAVSPITYSGGPAGAEPIDKWIWENHNAFQAAEHDTLPDGLQKPGQFQSFNFGKDISIPLKLSPQQLDRFQEQAGNGLKMAGSGLGAKDYLNSLVLGNNPDADAQREWNNATPERQATMVQWVVNSMRGAAKKNLLQEFPDLREAALFQARKRAAQLTGANGVLQGAPAQ